MFKKVWEFVKRKKGISSSKKRNFRRMVIMALFKYPIGEGQKSLVSDINSTCNSIV